MRNTTKTAWIANIETAEGFRVDFPMTVAELMDAWSAWHELEAHSDCADVYIAELEGFYGFASVYDSLGELDDIAERLERLEDEGADKLEAMAEVMDNLDDIERAWNESYFIADTTLVDYAELEAEERGDIPASLPEYIRFNIDWDSIATDMELSREYYEVNGGVLRVAQ